MSISTPDDWVTVSQVQIGRAFVASGRGDHERAASWRGRPIALVDAHEYVTLQQEIRLSRGEILLAAGRADEARRRARRGPRGRGPEGLDRRSWRRRTTCSPACDARS